MKIEALNLSSLRYFIDTVSLESMTLCAEKNHVSRPAVSQALVRLESVIDTKLFQHQKRTLVLTKEGQDFYQKASHAMDLFARALNEDEEKGGLKIGCTASLVDLVFPRIKNVIAKSHQPVIRLGPAHELMELLDNETVQIAFCLDRGRPDFKSLKFHSGYFNLYSKSGSVEKMLVSTGPRAEVDSFHKAAKKSGIQFDTRVEVESWTVALNLARHGLGCCIAPDFADTRGLKKISIKAWHPTYTASLFFRQNRKLSELEEMVVSLFGGDD